MKKVVFQIVSGENVLGEFSSHEYALIFFDGLVNKIDQFNPDYVISIRKNTVEVEEKKEEKKEESIA